VTTLRLNLMRISADVKFGGIINFKCSLQTRQEKVNAFIFCVFIFLICLIGAISIGGALGPRFDNDDFSAFQACQVATYSFFNFSFLISIRILLSLPWELQTLMHQHRQPLMSLRQPLQLMGLRQPRRLRPPQSLWERLPLKHQV